MQSNISFFQVTKTLGITFIRNREPRALKGACVVREGAGAFALAYFIHLILIGNCENQNEKSKNSSLAF